MMEREFVAQKIKELQIKKFLENKLDKVGLSEIKLKKIPLGEKIIIYTSRPGLIVGSKGANIKDLTYYLKKEFKLENPQIEINEIKDVYLDANVVAEKIVTFLERFGSARFKSIGHKTMENVINAGALGVEIIISGKIPGARAKSWRFYQGYLKKCGDISLTGVRKAIKVANLKSGTIGIKVSIMPPDVELPDKITIYEEPIEAIEGAEEEKKTKGEQEEKKAGKKKTAAPGKAKSGAAKEKKKKEAKEKKTEKKKEEVKEKIPSAEELIQATKEKFAAEETRVREPQKPTAQELIEMSEMQSISEHAQKLKVFDKVKQEQP